MQHESNKRIFTSESVTEGHPDKLCDQISDAVLDALLTKERALEDEGYVSDAGVPARVADVRCACETFATAGTIVVAGEIRTQAYIDVQEIARNIIKKAGYTDASCGFDVDSCGVLNLIHEQSLDIALGVDAGAKQVEDELDSIGAGDQGIMFGYACDETCALMPMPIHAAHRLAERLAQLRKSEDISYLLPDGKTQVSVEYGDDGRPLRASCIVVSTQHRPEIENMNIIKQDLVEQLIAPVMDELELSWAGAEIYVNPTGRFTVGGPAGDTGLTGRKIIVDTYGGMGRHGGGCFSGKDATKVDRSASYAARWAAKNVVAAGLAKRCELQLAYAIGVAQPISVMVDTHGTGVISDAAIEAAVREVFDLRPAALIRDLNLLEPIFSKTAAYGHFGRENEGFAWERCDRVEDMQAAAGM